MKNFWRGNNKFIASSIFEKQKKRKGEIPMTIKFDTEIPNTQFKVMATLMPGLEKKFNSWKRF